MHALRTLEILIISRIARIAIEALHDLKEPLRAVLEWAGGRAVPAS